MSRIDPRNPAELVQSSPTSQRYDDSVPVPTKPHGPESDEQAPTVRTGAGESRPRPFRTSTSSPNTSESASLIAPDWYRYRRPHVFSVTAWPHSCATTSSLVTFWQ